MWSRNKARKVIFAVDEEKETEKAFEHFAKCLHDSKDEITLINVLIPPVFRMNYTYPALLIADQDYPKEAWEKYENSKKLLESYMKKCHEMNLNCQQEILELHDKRISDSICSYAEGKADVIVMSSGKRSLLETLLLGSTTANTVKNSTVPVLVIPNLDSRKPKK